MAGICPDENPNRWIRNIISQLVSRGINNSESYKLVFLLPEGLLGDGCAAAGKEVDIGCQSVHHFDTQSGGNFGAFTSFKPATAQKNLGAAWTIIAHSEERNDYRYIFSLYEKKLDEGLVDLALEKIWGNKLICALKAGLNILFCVGERAEDRSTQGGVLTKSDLEIELSRQLEVVARIQIRDDVRFVIGYEPVWAIGPGKTPPDGTYIQHAATLIKSILMEKTGREFPVVYGGGLKKGNSAKISLLPAIDGGLIGLTEFTDPLGISAEGITEIIERFMASSRETK
jgi:triosephosphate isomerase